METVVKLIEVELVNHPPYLDHGLTAELGQVFRSDDGRFKATYWVAKGPGKLLEHPKSDELICVLQGTALVERGNEQSWAGPGDVILWLQRDPPLITVQDHLAAFCVVYTPPPRE